MRPHLTTPPLLVALLLATACSDGAPDWSDPERIAFAASLEIDLSAMTRTASGLYIQDLTVGAGPQVAAGNVIRVGYVGSLPDGRVFESVPASNPVEFPLTGLIAGWQQGIPGMRSGGERLLVIPPALAYGDVGSRGIPPRSTLVFRIQLVEILGTAGD